MGNVLTNNSSIFATSETQYFENLFENNSRHSILVKVSKTRESNKYTLVSYKYTCDSFETRCVFKMSRSRVERTAVQHIYASSGRKKKKRKKKSLTDTRRGYLRMKISKHPARIMTLRLLDLISALCQRDEAPNRSRSDPTAGLDKMFYSSLSRGMAQRASFVRT